MSSFTQRSPHMKPRIEALLQGHIESSLEHGYMDPLGDDVLQMLTDEEQMQYAVGIPVSNIRITKYAEDLLLVNHKTRPFRSLPYMHRWTTRHAVDIYNLTMESLDHELAPLMFYPHVETSPDTPSVREITNIVRTLWRKTNDHKLIVLQDDFRELLEEVTQTIPREGLRQEDLIARHATVYLQTPLSVDNLDVDIRGLHWSTNDEGLVSCCVLTESFELVYYSLPDFKTSVNIPTDGNDPDPNDPLYDVYYAIVGIIRSLGAIRQSSLASQRDIKIPSKKLARAKGKQRQPKAGELTYLSLIPNAPTASNAAASRTTHGGMRRHRVAGHWRQQWYPSAQEHRSIWIEAHFRGELGGGILPTQKVYVGKL